MGAGGFFFKKNRGGGETFTASSPPMLLKSQDSVGGSKRAGQGDALWMRTACIPPLLVLGFSCASSLQTFFGYPGSLSLGRETTRELMMRRHRTVAAVLADFSPSLVLCLQCWWEPQAN